jgi:uncharacterized integral membrane protein
MQWLKAIIWVIFFGIIMVFVVQNLSFFDQEAQLNFNLWLLSLSFSLKLYLLLFFSFLLGAFFGITYTFKGWLKNKKGLKQREKELKGLREELDSLRNLPLAEEKLEDL